MAEQENYGGEMLIGTNRLLRWSRDEIQIQIFWPQGNRTRIDFDTIEQSRAFLNCLDQLAETPEIEEFIVAELDLSGIANAKEIVDALLAKGALKRTDGGSAAEARSYNALAERQAWREVNDEFVFDQLYKAHQDQFESDHALPAPTEIPDLKSLFRETVSSYSTASDPISDSDISTLLAYAYGRHDTWQNTSQGRDFRGTTPSAGGLYPLKLVIKTKDTLESTTPFALQYQRNAHAFKRLEVSPDSGRWAKSMTKFLSNHGLYMLISIMFDLKWSEQKYGLNAYRFALLEAGAVMQNLRLLSPRLGLRNWPCGVQFGPGILAALPGCRDQMHALSIGFGKPFER